MIGSKRKIGILCRTRRREEGSYRTVSSTITKSSVSEDRGTGAGAGAGAGKGARAGAGARMRPGDARRQAAVMEDIKSSQPNRREDEVLPQREAIVEVNVSISISVPRG